jgi:hypothetical protein
MKQHLVTAVIVAFWITMTALLWRAESGDGSHFESQVPLQSVIDRILNAADPSTLRLSRHGIALGQLRWLPSVRELPIDTNSVAPEGMVASAIGYHIDLDLTLSGTKPEARWYFVSQFDLNLKHEWEEVVLRLIQRPTTWEIRTTRGDDAIHLSVEEGRGEPFRQRFAFSELAQLTSAIAPIAPFLPAILPKEFANPNALSSLTNQARLPTIRWEATDSSLRVGRHRMRAYRIRGRLLENLEVVLYVSRAGELLHVELPDHYVLTSVASATSHEPTATP